MTIERWEMLLSSKPDCYFLKIRGDRSDAETIVQDHPHACQGPEEIEDPVYQWVVFVVDATLAEKLAIQNQVLSLTQPLPPPPRRAPSPELTQILNDLTVCLENISGLTPAEEQRVLKRVKDIHDEETTARPEGRPLPVLESGSGGPLRLRAAIFYPPNQEKAHQKFQQTLADVSQRKSKKPLFIDFVHSEPSEISPLKCPDWIASCKAAGAEIFFVVLGPRVPREALEGCIIEAREADLYCFLVPSSEISSRLLYVELMVEMKLVQYKESGRE